MSYRNPKLIIDTKTGKYLRQMGESVAGSTVRAIQGIRAQQDALKKQLNDNIKATQQRRVDADKTLLGVVAGIKKAQLNQNLWQGANIVGLQEMLEQANEILMKPTRTTEETNFLANIMTLPDRITTDMTGIGGLSNNYSEYLKTQGLPGGLAADAPQNQSDFVQGFWQNNIQGERQVSYDCSGPGGCVLTYSYINKDGVKTAYDSNQIDEIVQQDSIETVFALIPSYDKKTDEVISEIFSKKNEDGSISKQGKDEFYEGSETITRYDPTTRKRTKITKVNRNVWMEATKNAFNKVEGGFSLTGKVSSNNSVLRQIEKYKDIKGNEWVDDYLKEAKFLSYDPNEPVTAEQSKDLSKHLATLAYLELGDRVQAETLPKASADDSESIRQETNFIADSLEKAIEEKDKKYFTGKSFFDGSTQREIQDVEFDGDKMTLVFYLPGKDSEGNRNRGRSQKFDPTKASDMNNLFTDIVSQTQESRDIKAALINYAAQNIYNQDIYSTQDPSKAMIKATEYSVTPTGDKKGLAATWN